MKKRSRSGSNSRPTKRRCQQSKRQPKPKKRGTKKSAKRQKARSAKRRTKKEARGSRTRLRRIRKGVTYLITKKTNDDQFILRPDGSVNLVLLYLLILKINKHGLLLHGFVAMSNHLHLVVTDVRGRLPKFMREFLSESGKAIKLAVGTTRRVWSPERYSAVELLDRDAVERMLTYCQTNPTEAGLTMPKDWPGLTSANYKIGDVLRAEKPGFYFGANRPDLVSCQLSPIPKLIGELNQHDEELTPEAYRARCQELQENIDQRVERSVEEILLKRRQAGKTALAGREAVLAASRTRRGNHPFREGINPQFATTNPELMKKAKAEFKAFCAAHDEAKESYIAGNTGVYFPHGTYGYRELLRVNVRKGGVAV